MPQSVCVLGSTGSIGTQVLEVIAQFPERFKLHSLSAGRNMERLAQQIRQFHPSHVVIQHPDGRDELLHRVSSLQPDSPHPSFELWVGEDALTDLPALPNVDTVVVGLVGLTGLAPTLAALQAGKTVLTANKETFVAGGHLVQPYLTQIRPIDSEHSAIHQCLGQWAQATTLSPAFASQYSDQAASINKLSNPSMIDKLYLTASGGPFRTWSEEKLAQVTLRQALQHPNWVMGQKITIDSATMMNKGLEVIEAHWLFGVDYDQIQIVVHPQSLLHSGVAFVDGSILFQAGPPDMRGPIQYAMFYPERVKTPFEACKLDLLSIPRLDLEPPDPDRFPCLRLAYEAGRLGGSATCVLNAADEAAVALFLQEQIRFTDIPRLIEQTLEFHLSDGLIIHPTLEDIRQLDQWTRGVVEDLSATSSTQILV